ncbi:MAG: hypothetical protein KHY47_10730 [Prevotella sp.]|nr:hypothetical protein [Prevotella sp.]
MILIKKKIQTVCSCKDREKSWFAQIFPHIILTVSLKNRSFAAEIALDPFSMPTFLDLYQ